MWTNRERTQIFHLVMNTDIINTNFIIFMLDINIFCRRFFLHDTNSFTAMALISGFLLFFGAVQKQNKKVFSGI